MIDEMRHIRAFLKVAETRNFTRAANNLHISQSALTVQIQKLEESLGVQLFDRNKRGVTLTAAGHDILGPLQRLFNDAQTIVEHARELSSVSTGSVNVAALPTVCAGVLPNLVKSYIARFPGIRIQIMDLVAERVREAVLKRQVDLGVGTQHGRDSELRATPLFQDRLVVFVSAAHPLAVKQSITLREATAFHLILPARNSSVRDTVEAIAHRERVALQIQYETNFMPTALAFVRAGLGIAILPESAVDHGAPEYVRIPLNNRFSTRQIELLQRKDSTLSPAAETFAQFLTYHLQRKGSAVETSRSRSRRHR